MVDGNLKNCSLADLAVTATNDWNQVSAGARPYLGAMLALQTLDDAFGADPAVEVVSYFLANATGWRGPVAKLVKAELRRRLAERFH